LSIDKNTMTGTPGNYQRVALLRCGQRKGTVRTDFLWEAPRAFYFSWAGEGKRGGNMGEGKQTRRATESIASRSMKEKEKTGVDQAPSKEKKRLPHFLRLVRAKRRRRGD